MKSLERFTAVSVFLSSMSFFFTVLYGKNVRENTLASINTGELHTGVTIVNLILYLLLSMFVASRYRQFLRAIALAWPILILAGFCLLSTFWSIDPELTLRRSAFLIGTTLAGIYLGSRYTVTEITEILLMSFYTMCAFTLIYRIAAPSYVIDVSHGNALRGLTLHKNGFGEIMAIFFLQLLLWVPQKRRRFIRYASIPLSFGLLLLSRSSTSLIVCVLVASIIPTLRVLKLPFRQRWPAVVFTGIFFASVMAGLIKLIDPLLGLIGKDATLTGRFTIWKLVLVSISRRPLLGYGFDVYWQGLKGESLEVIAGSGWLVPSAHNGYLQAALDIGYVGLALVLIILAIAAKRAISYARSAPDIDCYWPITFLLFYVLHASAEASLLTREGIGILFFVTLYTSLAKAASTMSGVHVPQKPERLVTVG